jgi:stage V sporulation protein K
MGFSIEGLVKAMEDHKDKLILILAGYRTEMEHFLESNPGLRSRFPICIDFPDYSQQELLQIAELICKQRQYQLTVAAKSVLLQKLTVSQNDCCDHFGNARTVRNIIEKALRRQAIRLITHTTTSREELLTIQAEDLREAPYA